MFGYTPIWRLKSNVHCMMDSDQNYTSFGIFNFIFVGAHIMSNLATLKGNHMKTTVFSTIFFLIPQLHSSYQRIFPPLKIGIAHRGEM